MIPATLIERCARKEPKAQYELYKALYPLMMSICSRYERDKQEAAARMNQGFLKVLEGLDRIRPEVPFKAWVSRVMINTVIDEHRRTADRRAREVPQTGNGIEQGNDRNEYLREMEAEAFAKLLLRVPTVSRHVFNLFAIDGYSHAEIAELLSISTGTSKWHVSHARSILQKALAEMAVVPAETRTQHR